MTRVKELSTLLQKLPLTVVLSQALFIEWKKDRGRGEAKREEKWRDKIKKTERDQGQGGGHTAKEEKGGEVR